MVESVTVFDEDFTDEDMDAALGFLEDEARRCSSCGFPAEETMAEGRMHAYDAEIVVCHACAAGDRAENALRQAKTVDTAGIKRRIWERPPRREPPPE